MLSPLVALFPHHTAILKFSTLRAGPGKQSQNTPSIHTTMVTGILLTMVTLQFLVAGVLDVVTGMEVLFKVYLYTILFNCHD